MVISLKKKGCFTYVLVFSRWKIYRLRRLCKLHLSWQNFKYPLKPPVYRPFSHQFDFHGLMVSLFWDCFGQPILKTKKNTTSVNDYILSNIEMQIVACLIYILTKYSTLYTCILICIQMICVRMLTFETSQPIWNQL
jgi:hypothetical protein